MVRNFKIQCPHCRDTCELYLSTAAPIVILNCPNCWTPMLHNEKGVFSLSQKQLNDLAHARDFSILNLLEKVASPEALNRKLSAVRSEEPFWLAQSSHATFNTSRQEITRDDIVDLQIELETCKDSLEFINRI